MLAVGWLVGLGCGRSGGVGPVGRLLPLVRFSMMAKPGLVMMSEPLMAGHPLAFQLHLETTKDFAGSARAAS